MNNAIFEKVNVLGINASVCTYENAVREIIKIAKMNKKILVSACNVHVIVSGLINKEYQNKLNEFDIVVPDGQPIKWAINLFGKKRLKDRVRGPELMLRICSEGERESLKVFFYGSTNLVLEKLEENLKKKYKNLEIVGKYSPPFRTLDPEEINQIANMINESGAEICFVGLGCPKQENWAFDNRNALNPILICVGAAFDFHAGIVKQAPIWMQNMGLEWFFRFMLEPRRLWKRYLITNIIFLFFFFLKILRLKKIE